MFIVDVAEKLLILFLRVRVTEMLPELLEGHVTMWLLCSRWALAIFFEGSEVRLLIDVVVGVD